MSERRYEVTLPNDMLCSTPTTAKLTEQQIDELIENAKKAKAEVDKPKTWDFGVYQGAIVIRGRDLQGWGGGDSPIDQPGRQVNDRTIHVLGNFKEIIEQQGPIVVGMSVEAARQFRKLNTLLLTDGPYGSLRADIESALARYERNKP